MKCPQRPSEEDYSEGLVVSELVGGLEARVGGGALEIVDIM